MGAGLFIFPLLSLATAFGSYSASKSSGVLFSNFWFSLFFFQELTSAFFLLVSITFFSKKVCIKFQKLQMLLLVLSAPQMAFNLTLVFLVKAKIDSSSFPFTLSLTIYLLAILLIFAMSILRAFRLLRSGQFRKDGGGLLGNRRNNKSTRFSNIFGFALVAAFCGSLGAAFLGDIGMDIVTIIVMFGISAIIYSVGLTEFAFILYCKIRYPSFNISMEQENEEENQDELMLKQLRMMERQKKEKLKKQRHEKRNR
jgi:hypothetical protein